MALFRVLCGICLFDWLQKPIRRGVVGHTLMVEELGRRKVNHGVMACISFEFQFDLLSRFVMIVQVFLFLGRMCMY